ncbi:Lar family restriction alleviation protein [Ruminococcaceae bacterium OttesenSCG-928-D13]|nr:Lar family restriction alleviation protein [Ruminococcaceae bacterium OttesenSCG-928-D13]
MSEYEREQQVEVFWGKHPDAKPCPFCGSDVIAMKHGYNRRDYFFIKCEVCGASSKAANDPEATFARWQMRKQGGD